MSIVVVGPAMGDVDSSLTHTLPHKFTYTHIHTHRHRPSRGTSPSHTHIYITHTHTHSHPDVGGPHHALRTHAPGFGVRALGPPDAGAAHGVSLPYLPCLSYSTYLPYLPFLPILPTRCMYTCAAGKWVGKGDVVQTGGRPDLPALTGYTSIQPSASPCIIVATR